MYKSEKKISLHRVMGVYVLSIKRQNATIFHYSLHLFNMCDIYTQIYTSILQNIIVKIIYFNEIFFYKWQLFFFCEFYS